MSQTALPAAELGQTADVVKDERPSPAALGRRLARPASALGSVPHIGTYTGVVLAAIGGILLTIAWGKTAGLTVVSLQIPYLISAGFTGVALVTVGLTVINLSAKHADARARSQQLTELRDLLAELRTTLEPKP